MSSTDLTKASTIHALAEAWRVARHDLIEAFAKVAELERDLNAVFTLGDSNRTIHAHLSHESIRWEDPTDQLDRMERDAWKVIVDRLELRRFMSTSRYEDLYRRLDKGDMPELTEANIRDFVREHHVAMPDMLGEMVTEVFDWLRPRGWALRAEYQTNRQDVVGRKVILTGMVERNWKSWSVRWTHGDSNNQMLIALENLFSGLDGRGTICKTFRSAISNELMTSTDGRGRTPYFAFKSFKNGNMHLEFLRLDLLRKFNQLAASRRALPKEASP